MVSGEKEEFVAESISGRDARSDQLQMPSPAAGREVGAIFGKIGVGEVEDFEPYSRLNGPAAYIDFIFQVKSGGLGGLPPVAVRAVGATDRGGEITLPILLIKIVPLEPADTVLVEAEAGFQVVPGLAGGEGVIDCGLHPRHEVIAIVGAHTQVARPFTLEEFEGHAVVAAG